MNLPKHINNKKLHKNNPTKDKKGNYIEHHEYSRIVSYKQRSFSPKFSWASDFQCDIIL